jgi:hypothetical protein
MNKIRIRMIIGGNYTDYEVETKVKSESGFKDFIKKELEQWGIKPLCYRFDLIIDGKETKTKMSIPVIDKRFL